jgi:CRP-like cAMP-binding protein
MTGGQATVVWSDKQNGVLHAFGLAGRCAMSPATRKASLKAGELLMEAGSPLRSVYFPLTCLVSVVEAVPDGQTTDGFLVGSEGALGLVEALGGNMPTNDAFVIFPGDAYVIDAADVAPIVRQAPFMMAVAQRYAALQLGVLHQRVACALTHSLQQRLAGLLLRCSASLHSTDLPVTSAELGKLLGASPARVSAVLRDLESRSLVVRTTGHVSLTHMGGLEAVSCACGKAEHELSDQFLASGDDSEFQQRSR